MRLRHTSEQNPSHTAPRIATANANAQSLIASEMPIAIIAAFWLAEPAERPWPTVTAPHARETTTMVPATATNAYPTQCANAGAVRRRRSQRVHRSSPTTDADGTSTNSERSNELVRLPSVITDDENCA